MDFQPSLIQTTLMSLAVSIISGAIIALVTVKLAIGRFRSERMWDRKAQAYADVLTALFHLRAYSQVAILRLEENRALGEGLDQLAEKSASGREEIRRTAALGTFVLCPDAARRLEQLVVTLDDPQYNMDLHEIVSSDLVATQEALVDLREIARRDLHIR